MTFLIKAAQLILSLSILVVFHEFGHFFWSKLFKARVDKFYMFFNPKFSLLRMKKVDGKVRVRFFARNVEDAILPLKDENGDEKKDDKGRPMYRPMTDEERAALPVGDWRRDPDNTEFGIGWVPFGGYCRIIGMVDETQTLADLAAEPQKYEFRSKRSGQRLLIMAGGVINNLLLAFFLYAMVIFTWGDTYRPLQGSKYGMEFNERAEALGFRDHDVLLRTDKKAFSRFDSDMLRAICSAKEVTVLRDGEEVTFAMPDKMNLLDFNKDVQPFVSYYSPMVLSTVVEEGGAARAGLQVGDSIVSVNGHEAGTFATFSYVFAQLKLQEDEGHIVNHDVLIAFKRDGALDSVKVAADAKFMVGVAVDLPYEYQTDNYGFWQSIPKGIAYGWNTLKGYVSDFRYVFTKDGAQSLGGFGTIGSIFPATWNWYSFWMMTAFLSVILAFMNILPIPGLDGGHILFLLWEIVTGKKPGEKFLERAEWVGFLLLMALMIYANMNDVIRMLF